MTNKVFGGDHPLVHPSNLIRDKSALSESGEALDDKTAQNNAELVKNLGIVTLNFADDDKAGFDRESLKKIMDNNPLHWKEILQSSIKPTTNSFDPRNHQEKTIFAADSKLSELMGGEVLVKIAEKSGDGLTPEQQFEAGKILNKEILKLGLEDIIEVNKAFGYIQQGDKNYLFLEKVDGYNFQQMQRKEEEDIPDTEIRAIFQKLIDKLNHLKSKIVSNPDYIEGERLYNQGKLKELFERKKYVNSIFHSSNEENSKLKLSYPYGFAETNQRYKIYYVDNFGKIKRLNLLIDKIIQESIQLTQNKYNLISEVIQRIFLLESTLRISFYNEIKKSSKYGQDNLMWDRVKKKIIIIDPGPPQKNRWEVSDN